MLSFRTTIAYDGSRFAGWQRQPGARTVQGEFERVLTRIARIPISATASGRTDAGVHALGQVVGFHAPWNHPPAVLLKALNAELPGDISALDLGPAPENFDPIRHALRKRYRYVIEDTLLPHLFSRHYHWRVRRPLNVAAMNEAAQALVGKHDFASFQTAGSSRVSTIRTVYELLVERRTTDSGERVVIEVEADGFLYNMVRNFVGTLALVGRNKRSRSWPGEVLAALNRQAAGMTAPAQGLFLLWVKYE